MRLQLGSSVRCTDGLSGELCAAVMDPTRRRITQLVVEPRHHHALARRVPVELVDVGLYEKAAAGRALSLRCTIEELHRLTPVQEYAYVGLTELPPDDPRSDVGAQEVLTLPDDGYTDPATDPGWDDPHVWITYDSVPKGEIEIRRKSVVTSTDGHRLGHVGRARRRHRPSGPRARARARPPLGQARADDPDRGRRPCGDGLGDAEAAEGRRRRRL